MGADDHLVAGDAHRRRQVLRRYRRARNRDRAAHIDVLPVDRQCHVGGGNDARLRQGRDQQDRDRERRRDLTSDFPSVLQILRF